MGDCLVRSWLKELLKQKMRTRTVVLQKKLNI